ETWGLSLDGNGTWVELTPPGTPPAGLHARQIIHDPVRDRLVILSEYNDVWTRSLSPPLAWTHWTPTGEPPAHGVGQSAVYDPVRDHVVVFGGITDNAERTNQVWALSLSDKPAWTQLTPSGVSPSPRVNHSAIYDPVRDRMVVYAGSGRVELL